MNRAASRLFPWLVTAAGIAAYIGLQVAYDNANAPLKDKEHIAALKLSTPLVPSTGALKAISLGAPSVTADILWLQTIQYFGSGDPYGNYPSLGPLLQRITQLDPQFEYPYEMGLVSLTFMQQTPAAISLGKAAQTALPANQRGLVDFYFASDYLLSIKDYTLAAKYYKQDASEPNHPGAAQELAATALDHINTNLDDRQIAIEYWDSVRKSAKTDQERQTAQDWEDNLKIVYTLEQAASYYKQQHENYPATLQDLVAAGYVNQIPDSPVNRIFDYDSKTGKISFDQLKS